MTVQNDFEIDPTGRLVQYRGKTSTVRIPDTVREIGSLVFRGHTEITSVTIPDGVTEIGAAAFFECTGLIEIVLPDSVQRVGRSAFSKCAQLRRVVLGKSLRLLNDTGLEYRLRNVSLPDGMIQECPEQLDLRIRTTSVLKCLSPTLKKAVITGFLSRYVATDVEESEVTLFFGYLRRQRGRLIREMPSLPLCIFLTEKQILRPDEVDAWIAESDSPQIRAMLLSYKNSVFPSVDAKKQTRMLPPL